MTFVVVIDICTVTNGNQLELIYKLNLDDWFVKTDCRK